MRVQAKNYDGLEDVIFSGQRCAVATSLLILYLVEWGWCFPTQRKLDCIRPWLRTL